MTKEELRTKFDGLYSYMAMSRKTEYMVLFGNVMRKMMLWLVDNKPDVAEGYIETLCAIKWRQYLSRTEAEDIMADMSPAGAWDYDTWYRAMKALGLECERETVFNTYALWVVMNAVHSDNGAVVAKLLGIEPSDKTNSDYIRVIHTMALNMLLDEDGVYSVRRYFMPE